MLNLNSAVENINKIGKATAKKLQKLGINNVHDLLYYYPFRYNDYTATVPIAKLEVGANVNVQGEIEFIQNKRSFARRMTITECFVRDETGSLKIIWFNQPFITRSLKTGDKLSVSGRIDQDFAGILMSSPEYEKITAYEATHTKGLVPVYNLTGGLTNKQLRFLIKSIICMATQEPDFLSPAILKKYDLIVLSQSLHDIHFPADSTKLAQAKRRLQFNELFLTQLANEIRKSEIKSHVAMPIIFYEKETKKFVDNLPFTLTGAQKKAAWEILRDLEREEPMSRLLEGDVGSGKTVTVAMAALNVALNKKQIALLAPTEILATQHFATISDLFKNNQITVGLFTRSRRQVNDVYIKSLTSQSDDNNSFLTKKEMLKAVKDGSLEVIIGTHAMLQEAVEFKNLALAVIDEQHRFGVEQRKKLREKTKDQNVIPHLLSMTATPIPRSLAQTVYGDLDLSIINQMPKNRKPIKTYVVPEQKRLGAYEFVKKEISQGRQAFVVCPLITESDKLGVKSVEQEYKKLSQDIFPNLEIAYLHGKMKTTDKEKIMQQFLDNKINILISTSVIEVGVDVPNATLMILEGAERFGMAQLHQFRGRVGRGHFQSYCLLFSSNDDKTAHRLKIFATNNDGFKLAEEDLKMRGPGEVYGTAQKGFPEFKLASLNDRIMVKQAGEVARLIMESGIDNQPLLLNRIKKELNWIAG